MAEISFVKEAVLLYAHFQLHAFVSGVPTNSLHAVWFKYHILFSFCLLEHLESKMFCFNSTHIFFNKLSLSAPSHNTGFITDTRFIPSLFHSVIKHNSGILMRGGLVFARIKILVRF